MKGVVIYFLLVFFFSCATKKLQVPTTAIDINTGANIKENSIQLEKGKIAYIYSTQYGGLLSGRSIFENIGVSNFSGSHGASDYGILHGSTSRSSKVDTIINNDLIVQVALQEALMNSPLGFQYQDIPQHEFTDNTGKLKILIVREKFNPDIIVNLKSLYLKLTGNAHTGHFNIFSESYTRRIGNSHGNILMDYVTVWEIQDIKRNTNQSIRQEGRYVSVYYEGYSENVEIMTCAKKIGKEFSSLFENSYPHAL